MKTRVMICLIVIIAALCALVNASADGTLRIDGEFFSEDQVKSDQKGTGWTWTAADRKLTLSGYNGGAIDTGYIWKVTLELANGTDNVISGSLRSSSSGIYIAGGGSLTTTMVSVNSLTAENVTLTATGGYCGIHCDGFRITNCVVNASGSEQAIEAGYANINNCELNLTDSKNGLKAGGVTMTDTTLTANGIKETAMYNNDDMIFSNATIRASGCKFAVMAHHVRLEGCDVDLDTTYTGFNTSSLYAVDSNISVKGGSFSAIDSSYVTFNGGNTVKLTGDSFGISAIFVTISKADAIDIKSGFKAIFNHQIDSIITIDEKEAVVTSNRVVIKDGAIVSQETLPYALNIAGRRVSDDELSKPLSGEGWSWEPNECLITLDNYSAGPVSVGGETIKMRLIGENEAKVKVYAKLDLSGDGKLTCQSGGISALELVMSEAVLECEGISVDGSALVKSGKLHATSGLFFGGLTLRGGEIVCNNRFGDITVDGDLDISGGRVLAVNNIEVKGNLNMTGGFLDSRDLTPHNYRDKDATSIRVDKDVTFTGGEMNLYCVQVALTAKGKVTIGGTANATIEGAQGGISAKKVTIGGERFTGNDSVKVVNGQLASAHSLVVALQFGDSAIYTDRDHTDAAGEGWKWNAKKKLITLSPEFKSGEHSNDMGVFIPGVTVKVEGTVGEQGRIDIDCSEYVTFKGPGTLHATISAEKGMKLTGKLTARLGGLGVPWNPKKPTTIQNATVYAKWIDGFGNAVIKNSRVFVDENIDISGYLTITNSVLHTTSTWIDVYDVRVRGKLTAKNSAILGIGISCEKKSLSGTMVFKYGRVNDNSDDGYVLIKSATMNRAMTLPKADYLIPKGVKLTANKKLTIPGRLYVEGKISGKIESDNIKKGEPVAEKRIVSEVEIV